MKKKLFIFLFLIFSTNAFAQSASIPYDILYGKDVLFDLTQKPILAVVQTELAQSGLLGNIPAIDLSQNKIQELYYNNGSVFRRAFIFQNQLNKEVLYFYRNGSLLAKIPYQNGEINGTVFTYFPNGNIKMQIKYKNSKPIGKAVMYHDNQNTHVIEYYEQGKRNGVQKRYDTRENLRSVIPYLNGEIHGEVFLYNQNGDTIAHLKYDNGTVIFNECTTRTGNTKTLSPLGLYQLEYGMRPVVCGISSLEDLIATTTE